MRAARRLGIAVASGFHTRFDEYLPEYGAAWLQATACAGCGASTTRPAQPWCRPRSCASSSPTTASPACSCWRARSTTCSSIRAAAILRCARNGGIDGHGFAALYVGRLAGEKNLPLAVRAFRRIQQVRPKARFVFVGDGPLRERLQRENPDFIFAGIQRGDALARHFASGDLFLFPSRSETFGNVTLEAMASGLATVAFDYGAARQYLRHGVSGAAVNEDAAFIESAVRLAEDDALRQGMGAAAHASMQQLHPERVVADFEAVLRA